MQFGSRGILVPGAQWAQRKPGLRGIGLYCFVSMQSRRKALSEPSDPCASGRGGSRNAARDTSTNSKVRSVFVAGRSVSTAEFERTGFRGAASDPRSSGAYGAP